MIGLATAALKKSLPYVEPNNFGLAEESLFLPGRAHERPRGLIFPAALLLYAFRQLEGEADHRPSLASQLPDHRQPLPGRILLFGV